MNLFNWLVVPILSAVNEGVIASIVFSFLFIGISVYWYNLFRQWYYVKPLPILTCMLLCCIYWYYRAFTTNYTIIVSDLFHVGFSDIVITALTFWSIISMFINLFREKYYKKKKDILFKENSKFPLPKFEEDKPITCSEDDELREFGIILFRRASIVPYSPHVPAAPRACFQRTNMPPVHHRDS